MGIEGDSGGSSNALSIVGKLIELGIPLDGEVLTYRVATDDYKYELPPGAGGGEVNDGANVGAGAGIYKTKSGLNIHLKSIIGELNKINVTANLDDITITLGSLVELNSNKGIASGYASLDAGVLVPVAQIPNLNASKINAGIFNVLRIPDITESKISDLQNYLLNITAENFESLSDIPTHVGGTKILQRNAGDTAFEWITTPSGGGGGGEESFESKQAVGPGNNISFTGFTQVQRYKLIIRTRGITGASSKIGIQFNNDTTSAYGYRHAQNGIAKSASATDKIYVHVDSTNEEVAFIIVDILKDVNGDWRLNWKGGGHPQGNQTQAGTRRDGQGIWNGGAQITEIDVNNYNTSDVLENATNLEAVLYSYTDRF